MDDQTLRLIRRGVDGLAWVESRLAEIEKSDGASPDLLRMQRDCRSLLARLGEEIREAEDPEVDLSPMVLFLLSGQDLVFLQALRDFLSRDSSGGGGHLRALLELEGFISRREWV